MTLYWLTVLIVQRLLLKLIGATDNDSGSLTVSILASRDHSVSLKRYGSDLAPQNMRMHYMGHY